LVQPIIKHSIIAEVKANFVLSLPLMAAWVIYSLGPFAGTAMIARFGKDVLAASVLVGTIWIAVITFWFGFFHSVSVLVSQQIGAKNNDAVSGIIGQALLLNCFSWLPTMGLMLIIPFIVQWSAPNEVILQYATEYSHALLFAVPGLITLAMLEHFLNGIGKTKMSLCISLIEIPLEILFIYVFVFGKFGVPTFGLAGVGYGLSCSFTLTSLVILIYLYHAKFTESFPVFKYIGTINVRYCKEMVRVGLPIGLTYFVELIGFIMATYFISRFSAIALAAHQIILQFAAVFFNIPFAMSQAITIRVGMSVGQMDRIGVRYASYAGILMGLLFSFVIFFILVFFPLQLLSIDMNLQQNPKIVEVTTSLFLIFGIYQIFDSLRILEAGALRGLKDTKFTMVVNIICFTILGVLFAYLLGIVLRFNVQGVWYGLTVGIMLGAITLFFRLKKMINQVDLAELLII
jgi:MATE family multidrug resistance protein